MDDHDKPTWGTGSLVALGIVLIFLVTLLFGVLSALAGLVWTLIKVAVVMLVLWVVLRWAFKRSQR